MVNLTSIIVCAYDTLRIQRQITSACLGNIEKFTDKYNNEYTYNKNLIISVRREDGSP